MPEGSRDFTDFVEPRLSAGAVYDTLKMICAENNKDLDLLAPSVFTETLVALASVARAVASDRQVKGG